MNRAKAIAMALAVSLMMSCGRRSNEPDRDNAALFSEVEVEAVENSGRAFQGTYTVEEVQDVYANPQSTSDQQVRYTFQNDGSFMRERLRRGKALPIEAGS